MGALTIGTQTLDGAPAVIDASKFNRHTFWCGQSGSGKTYALGVVLEQLLLRTRLPLMILDPNSDFVRLGTPVADAPAEDAASIQEAGVRVLHSGSHGTEQLRTRFVDLSVPSKAAVLRLDPIVDAEEYNVLLHVDGTEMAGDERSYLDRLRASSEPGERKLGTRIDNLQVMDWQLWARGGSSATDVIDARPRATVLDLGGFEHAQESKVAALGLLEHLWRNRESRSPVLIVIDEAHNICPPNPTTPVERALLDLVVQIAAEGRKFGLWLLLSTQRPTKIHPNVLSQCDNLALMRMNSPRDLTELAEVFGYAPEGLIHESSRFAQGQSLFAGGFVSEPTLVTMGTRLTEQGGGDVRVPAA